MKQLVFLFLILIFCSSFSQNISEKEKNELLSILKNQQLAWNSGDIEGFMNGYWKSDSLKFIGKKGLTYGWQNTLENYKKSYPDKSAMGNLLFEIISVESLGEDIALVIGKWQLQRDSDNPNGYYSLIWKKMEGKWVIVADHSS